MLFSILGGSDDLQDFILCDVALLLNFGNFLELYFKQVGAEAVSLEGVSVGKHVLNNGAHEWVLLRFELLWHWQS